MPKVIELQNFSVWFFVTFPCDWWKRNSRGFFSEPNWKLRKKNRDFVIITFKLAADLLIFLTYVLIFASGRIPLRFWFAMEITQSGFSFRTLHRNPLGKISAQPHTTLCIQFLDREKNNKNNTLPLGKQICFTIVWGCTEILRWTKLSSELRFPSFTSQNFLMTNENVCKFLHVSFLYPQISVVRFGLLWSPSLPKRYFCTAHIQLLLLFSPRVFL